MLKSTIGGYESPVVRVVDVMVEGVFCMSYVYVEDWQYDDMGIEF